MHRVGLPQRPPTDSERMRREKGTACLEMAAATAGYGASCACVEVERTNEAPVRPLSDSDRTPAAQVGSHSSRRIRMCRP